MDNQKETKMAKKPLSFKDFMVVDYTPGMPDLISYRALKRHRGLVGESLRKDIAQASKRFPDRSTVITKDGKHGKVMTVGKDFVKVAHGNNLRDYKFTDIRPFNEETEEVNEVLDVAQRRKLAMRMKRLAPRIKIARQKAMKRTASTETIDRRTDRKVRNQFFKKLSKGKSRGDVSMAQRKQIEKRLARFAPIMKRIAVREKPLTRKLDRLRKQAKTEEKE
jgi:hypothetical protein